MADLHQAVIAGISQAITSLTKDLIASSIGLAKSQAGKLRAEFEIGFRKYLERNYERCSKVKTLLHRLEPVSIDSAYVETKVKFKQGAVKQNLFLKALMDYKRVVIIGMAGS